MTEHILEGTPASPGAAVGRARVLAPLVDSAAGRRTRSAAVERARAFAALQATAAAFGATARRLRDAGRIADAEIVDTGALMALDPALAAAVEAGVRDEQLTAAGAILAATELHAQRLASLPDPYLAARADDVRSIGRRASRLAAGVGDTPAAPEGFVLVAIDIGPADVADIEDGAAAIALAAGGATAHAAIVARSLGVPMVVGAGDALLTVRDGDDLVVDGSRGKVVIAPARERARRARGAMERRRARRAHAERKRDLPSVTRDGRHVRVLVNVAGAAEVRAGLAAGAEGVGLLRTELAFLDAAGWPSAADHRQALTPVVEALGRERTLTVRVLDFGGDKLPPFLDGTTDRGIAVLLAAPRALAAQLDAVVACAPGDRLRILLPMVTEPAQVDAARTLLASSGGACAALGAMIETPDAAAQAAELAAQCDFLSIGTNDLAHATLGSDRFDGGQAPAHHPRVLVHIAQAAAAASAAGIPLEVCGEAASDPVALPLLVGLGVDELSVGSARVGAVRGWVRALSSARSAEVARRALELPDAGAVAALVEAELGDGLREPADGPDEALEGAGSVGALGA